MDGLPVAERVDIGKEFERQIRNCLNNHYAHRGYNLKESTFLEDCNEKTDCWQITKSGKALRSAIKVRLNDKGEIDVKRTDILICLADPFYGILDPRTIKGRDILYEYFQYISLARGKIRSAKGKIIYNIGNALYNEFCELFPNFIPKPTGSGSKLMIGDKIKSKINPRYQVWLHYDAKSGRPKLLAFIPPNSLKENEEIIYHDFIPE